MKAAKKPTYHHGDLRNALRDAAVSILEEEGLAKLSLRSVARRAGVSHAAPYRHFPNHESLLSELALEGFHELRSGIAALEFRQVSLPDRITAIGGAYMRFVAKRQALTRLMFGTQPHGREANPELIAAVDAVRLEISEQLSDPVLGLSVWAAIHGFAMLTLENMIDLGQAKAGYSILPSRAEILLRSLLTVGTDQ